MLIFSLAPFVVFGLPVRDSMVCSIDFPVHSGKGVLSQRITYETVLDTGVVLDLSSWYFVNDHDSIALYELRFDNLRLKPGAGYIDLFFSKALNRHKMHEDFFSVLRKFDMVPAGFYKTRVRFLSEGGKDAILPERLLEQYADSTLSVSSGLKSKMNAAVSVPKPAQKNWVTPLRPASSKSSEAQVSAAEMKMRRNLRSVKGLDMKTEELLGKRYSSAYYKGFFLGRYELGSVRELTDRSALESLRLTADPSSMVINELEGYRGVGAQLKELNSKGNKDSRLQGIVEVQTYRASAQDPQSAIDQNYTELSGRFDAEVMGLPFSVEGFYTTQDAHRKAKASYVRFHYDVETAKGKLQQTINSYKSKLGETVSKGQGLEKVYGNYAQSLDARKAQLLSGLAREYGVSPESITESKGQVEHMITSMPDPSDTAALPGTAKDQLPAGSGSSGTAPASGSRLSEAQANKAKLLRNKKDITERYQEILALERQAAKYYKLLENYRTRTHLDSSVNYTKMAGLEGRDASYKDMSKAAAGILPEGKAKHFMTGLTSFDAGMINKYESGYTMAGQTMKGLSMGYDLGILKAGVTAGSTEYVSRDGNVDHYSSMLLRLDNKGSKNHKIGLIYNINTPASSMSVDENFIGKQHMRYPSFRTPTQIASVVYEGRIGTLLELHSELASSFKKGQSGVLDGAHSALNNSVAFMIPRTSISLNGAWEHLGKSFENNALPYIRSGTDRYTIGTAMDLFRSFLSLKLDYNYLVQENFSTTSYNRKWGFEVKTHSKRYPTVSFSYKPFSTFRSLADTLQIAQRPIQGSVWTARAGYQLKRNKQVHRFTLLFNQNSSTADTVHYSSSTAQLGYVYSAADMSLNASIGRIQLPADFALGSGLISSYVMTAGISKTIGKCWNVSLSPDIGICGWGLQRLSGSVGLQYRMPEKLLSFRTMLRYSNYKLSEAAEPLTLYAGQLGMSWQFKAHKKSKEQLR